MTTTELQNTIIRKILGINDNQLLVYLNIISAQGDDSNIYKLNDFEKKVINESLADYKKEKVITNEDVFTKTEKWLEE